SWMMSANHYGQDDNLRQPSSRSTVRFNNTAALHRLVTTTVSAAYTNRKINGSSKPSFSDLMRIGTRQEVPYMSLFDRNGNELPFYQSWNKNLIDTVGKGRLHDWNYFPISDWKYSDFRTNISELLGNVHVDIRIMEGLRLGLFYQIQNQSTASNRHYDNQSFYVRNLVNRFSQINENSGDVTYNIPNGDIIQRGISTFFSQSFRPQLDFNKN